MKRILKYFKPFVVSLMIAVALLFLQANADLALPDYMSRIVNIGIQQGGVESALPEAVRALTWDRLSLFLTGGRPRNARREPRAGGGHVPQHGCLRPG